MSWSDPCRECGKHNADCICVTDKKNTESNISEMYDAFFGAGYWEKEYKEQIVTFVKKCLQESNAL